MADSVEQGARLVQARRRRGFIEGKAAAAFFGWNYNTYSQHESGKRGLSRAAEKYAKGLRCSAAWLLTGEGEPGGPTEVLPSGHINLSVEFFRQAILFVLKNEGVADYRAQNIADILPEALAGEPIGVVDNDPLRSFQAHFEVQAPRSGRSKR